MIFRLEFRLINVDSLHFKRATISFPKNMPRNWFDHIASDLTDNITLSPSYWAMLDENWSYTVPCHNTQFVVVMLSIGATRRWALHHHENNAFDVVSSLALQERWALQIHYATDIIYTNILYLHCVDIQNYENIMHNLLTVAYDTNSISIHDNLNWINMESSQLKCT